MGFKGECDEAPGLQGVTVKYRERHISRQNMLEHVGALKRTGGRASDGFTEGYLCVKDVKHWQGKNWDKGIAQKESTKSERQGWIGISVVGIVSP